MTLSIATALVGMASAALLRGQHAHAADVPSNEKCSRVVQTEEFDIDRARRGLTWESAWCPYQIVLKAECKVEGYDASGAPLTGGYQDVVWGGYTYENQEKYDADSSELGEMNEGVGCRWPEVTFGDDGNLAEDSIRPTTMTFRMYCIDHSEGKTVQETRPASLGMQRVQEVSAECGVGGFMFQPTCESTNSMASLVSKTVSTGSMLCDGDEIDVDTGVSCKFKGAPLLAPISTTLKAAGLCS